LVLAVAAATIAAAWVNRGLIKESRPPLASVDKTSELTEKINDMGLELQHIAALVQALEQRTAAQQEEVKKLSDQLALRVEGLRKEVSALPPPPSAAPLAPRVASPRKRPPESSAGPISIGGAPLHPTAAPGDRH
jgi:hypothetical protein